MALIELTEQGQRILETMARDGSRCPGASAEFERIGHLMKAEGIHAAALRIGSLVSHARELCAGRPRGGWKANRDAQLRDIIFRDLYVLRSIGDRVARTALASERVGRNLLA